MKSRLTTVIFILGAMLVLTGALQAQSIEDQTRAALEQTDNLIEYAAPLVSAANNPISVRALELAKEFQARAWDAFNSTGQARFVQAKSLTLQARKLVQDALVNSRGSARGSDSQDGTVQARLDRAENRLDQAQQAMSGSDMPRLESLYQVARNNLDRAWEFYRSEKYRPALKLADQAEKTAKTIIDAANSTDRLSDQFDRRSSSVGALVSQATDGAATCSSPEGQAAAQMASRSYDLAQELATGGKPLQGLKELQSARELAQKSIRLCGGTPTDSVRLESRYESLKAELDDLTVKAQGLTGDLAQEARVLLQQAQELLIKAKSEIETNKSADAEATLQAAHLAISRARDYIGATR